MFFRAALPALMLILLPGCFSIPFISHGGKPSVVEPQQAEFDRSCVYVGYDGDHQPIVELRLINQEVNPDKGLIIHTRLFPTENFHVKNIFRGLRSINYYPIERRFHRLELRYGRKQLKIKVAENLQVRDTKPVDADFIQSNFWALLPDTMTAVKLKFQDVKHWGKLPADSLDDWYATKTQYIKQIEQNERRADLVDNYRRRQKQDDTKKYSQFDSVFVTTNNTYIYLEKDVDSDILFTANIGDKFDYGVSDGAWLEVPLPDTLKDMLHEFLDARRARALDQLEKQRKAARASRTPVQAPKTEIDTTNRFTGYILDVMVQKHYRDAVGWEMQTMADPVDVPLFAKVLTDREVARLARIDSIAKAQADSIKAYTDSLERSRVVADSIKLVAELKLKTDSLRADSLRAAAKAGKAASAADSLKKGAVVAAQAGAAAASADSSQAASKTPVDSLKPGAGKSQAADDRPPWAGTGRGHGRNRGGANSDEPAPPDSTAQQNAAPGNPEPPKDGSP